jgi:hypothetical protein
MGTKKLSPEVEKALADLHTALTNTLLARVKDKSATAADLAVARQFLKDNHIDGTPDEGTSLADLARQVPFKGVDEGDFRH